MKKKDKANNRFRVWSCNYCKLHNNMVHSCVDLQDMLLI